MNTRSLVLQADSHYRLPFPGLGHWRLVCTRGRLWITRTGAGRDHVLQAGSQQVFEAGDELLIGALLDSELQLEWLQAEALQNVPAWQARFVLLLQRCWQQPSSFAATGRSAVMQHKESHGAGHHVCPPLCEKLD